MIQRGELLDIPFKTLKIRFIGKNAVLDNFSDTGGDLPLRQRL